VLAQARAERTREAVMKVGVQQFFGWPYG